MEIKSQFIVKQINCSNSPEFIIDQIGYEKVFNNKKIALSKDLSSISLHYIYSGYGYIEINNKKIKIDADHVFILFPDTEIKYYPSKSRPWKYAWINFSGTKCNDLLSRLNLNIDYPIINATKKIGNIFTTTVIDCITNPKNSDIIATSSFYQIFSELLKVNIISPIENSINEYTNQYVSQAVKYIDSNFNNCNLNRKLVAAYLGLNEIYFSRIFKNAMLISYSNYVTKIRISEAVILMEKKIYIIKEISALVGFSDQYYFSKVFKKYNKVSPQMHINNLKKPKNMKE